MLRSNKADLLWFVLLAILVVGVIPYTLLPVKVAETGELVFGVTEILPQWMIGGLMALLLMLLGAVRLDTNARWASLGGILPLALAAAFFPIERQVEGVEFSQWTPFGELASLLLGFLIVLWLSALVECIRTKDFKVGKPSLLLLIWFAAGVALCALESLAVYMIKYMDFSNSIPILPVRIGGYALRLAVALGAGLLLFGGRKSRWMGIVWVVTGILTIFKIAQPFLGIARIPVGSYLYPLQGYNWNRCIAAEGLLLAAGVLALRRPAKTVKQTTGETV